MDIFLNALLIFTLRAVDVSMGTMRMIYIIQGRRIIAALVGFVEVSIFIVAISRTILGMHGIANIIAYAGGFSCGTLIGITIEHRLALGWAFIQIIVKNGSRDIAEALRGSGYGVTTMVGEGMKGPVLVMNTVVRRKYVRRVLQLINLVDAEAFVTIHDSRQIYRGYRGVAKKK